MASAPLKNITQLDDYSEFPIYGKIKTGPNHQPDLLDPLLARQLLRCAWAVTESCMKPNRSKLEVHGRMRLQLVNAEHPTKTKIY